MIRGPEEVGFGSGREARLERVSQTIGIPEKIPEVPEDEFGIGKIIELRESKEIPVDRLEALGAVLEHAGGGVTLEVADVAEVEVVAEPRFITTYKNTEDKAADNNGKSGQWIDITITVPHKELAKSDIQKIYTQVQEAYSEQVDAVAGTERSESEAVAIDTSMRDWETLEQATKDNAARAFDFSNKYYTDGVPGLDTRDTEAVEVTLFDIAREVTNANIARASSMVDRLEEGFNSATAAEQQKYIEDKLGRTSLLSKEEKVHEAITWTTLAEAQEHLNQAREAHATAKGKKKKQALTNLVNQEIAIATVMHGLWWSDRTKTYKVGAVSAKQNIEDLEANCVGIQAHFASLARQLFDLEVSASASNEHAFESVRLSDGRQLMLDHQSIQTIDPADENGMETWIALRNAERGEVNERFPGWYEDITFSTVSLYGRTSFANKAGWLTADLVEQAKAETDTARKEALYSKALYVAREILIHNPGDVEGYSVDLAQNIKMIAAGMETEKPELAKELYQLAFDFYEESLRYAPRNPYALSSMGRILYKKLASDDPTQQAKDYERAEGYYQQAIALDENNIANLSWLHTTYAWFLRNTGRNKDGITHMEGMVTKEEYSKDAAAHRYAGQFIYEIVRDEKNEKKDVGTDGIPTLTLLTEEQRGRLETAREYYDTAIELLGDDDAAKKQNYIGERQEVLDLMDDDGERDDPGMAGRRRRVPSPLKVHAAVIQATELAGRYFGASPEPGEDEARGDEPSIADAQPAQVKPTEKEVVGTISFAIEMVRWALTDEKSGISPRHVQELNEMREAALAAGEGQHR